MDLAGSSVLGMRKGSKSYKREMDEAGELVSRSGYVHRCLVFSIQFMFWVVRAAAMSFLEETGYPLDWDHSHIPVATYLLLSHSFVFISASLPFYPMFLI